MRQVKSNGAAAGQCVSGDRISSRRAAGRVGLCFVANRVDLAGARVVFGQPVGANSRKTGVLGGAIAGRAGSFYTSGFEWPLRPQWAAWCDRKGPPQMNS